MTIIFELPVASLVSANRTLRMQHWQRSRMRKALAWTVLIAMGRQRPVTPIARARIVVERHAPRPFDDDNLASACKHLFDVLQPFSTRHPNGLGVISSDKPAALTPVFRPVKCAGTEARIIVSIQELSAI